MNIFLVALAILSGVCGSWLHWRKVNQRGECGSFFDYLFKDGVNGTVSAAMGFCASMQAAYNGGLIPHVDVVALVEATKNFDTYPPLWTFVMACVMFGYTFDSQLNTSTPPGAKQLPTPEPDVTVSPVRVVAIAQAAPVIQSNVTGTTLETQP